ncbi:50S ribosomal protein L7/L12 [candidate division WWE3 bacterium CG_4_9_14_3_um_filter_41_6]|uniref:Large ribosomal subunit protein bL12 n=1 Tax=candidate division WWE3 bacterium CG_4_10_14_0_2_um_filter_41_14 TaxID=1975072 RepID=A0A2M7TKM0_UNCKA|nr:MAG: 50S ribosomal protein L7/L12 [candidate division WWE3 bacterium CG_4_10_14_0_2_um_filter_41_14]PJA39156.1 MAG: 50S ribosomal protein L7/L12 [candidate division WWE3 bacterium CG_4_9_14_3_um_filter_41_6]
MADLEKLVTEIEGLSVLEVSELVKALEEKFGVSAVQTVASGPAQGASADASAVEEKDSFTVELTATGDNKIGVIKAIREINGELGLKEAKDLADKAPSIIAEDVATEKANDMKAKLEAAGAKVELK